MFLYSCEGGREGGREGGEGECLVEGQGVMGVAYYFNLPSLPPYLVHTADEAGPEFLVAPLPQVQH